MAEIDPLAVAVATLAAFLLSGAWYALVPAPLPASGAGPAPEAAAEQSAVALRCKPGVAQHLDHYPGLSSSRLVIRGD